jgi:hypothetical protein
MSLIDFLTFVVSEIRDLEILSDSILVKTEIGLNLE